jgi:hypothetical protein
MNHARSSSRRLFPTGPALSCNLALDDFMDEKEPATHPHDGFSLYDLLSHPRFFGLDIYMSEKRTCFFVLMMVFVT